MSINHKSQVKPVLTGLIGSGIQASRSPLLYVKEAEALGFALNYQLFDLDLMPEGIDALGRILDEKEREGYAGLNITHPVKQTVIAYLDKLSDEAGTINAVNTVVFRNGERIGHNTDWRGYEEAFRLDFPDVSIESLIQLGAGGAGAAIAYAMLKMGTKRLYLFDLNQAKAEQLAKSLNENFCENIIVPIKDLKDAIIESDGLINCTPIGMKKYRGTPLPVELLHSNQWVSDLIYAPLETELLQAARKLGCRTSNGCGMLIFQALEAFRLFTGKEPDARRMLNCLQESIL